MMTLMTIDEAILVSQQNIQNALTTTDSVFREITSYLSQSTGKGVRSKLLLTSSINKDGLVPTDATKVAAALELLHMATLIHDDVLDDALIRRGMATIHQKFDVKSAILCGDFILSLSLSMLSSVDRLRLSELSGKIDKANKASKESILPRFSQALASVCKGEYLQHKNANNVDMSLYTYLRVISGKTAALFYVATYAGGILADETEENTQNLARFGRCLGMIFQIIDDCKDYKWTEEMAQKPVVSDLKNGVITLPLILAIKNDPPLRNIVKDFIAIQKAQNDFEHFLKALHNAKGVESAEHLANRYVKSAIKAIKGIAPKKRDALLKILYSIPGLELGQGVDK